VEGFHLNEEQLRQIVREEISKALEGADLTRNYTLNVQSGPQPVLWPLMALVHKWRIIQTGLNRSTETEPDSLKSGKAQAYSEAAKDLEEWIKSGKMTLDS
jgi:hypothetical protein